MSEWDAFPAVQQNEWDAFPAVQQSALSQPKEKFGWGDTWPAKIAKGLFSGFTLPGDVLAGKAQLPSAGGIPGSVPFGDPNSAGERVGDLAAMASPISPVSRAGAGWAGVVPPPKELARLPAPTKDSLLKTGGAQKEAATAVPHEPFHPELMKAFADNTKQVMNPKRERVAPQTFGMVDDIAKDGAIADLSVTRELLGEIAQSVDRKERRAATIAIKEIDKFLSRNEPAAAGLLEKGNANYAAGKRLQQLEELDAIGGLRTGRANSGGNEVNVRRQLVSPIVEKAIKGNSKGYSKDEIAALNGFVKGTPGLNTLRTASQLAPSKHGLTFGSPVSLLSGGASLAVGAGANKLAALLTRNQYQKIMDRVAKRSPAYTEALSKATDRYLAAAQDFSTQPTPAKLAGMVAASRALSSGLRHDGVSISSGDLLRSIQGPVKSAAEGDEPSVPGGPGQ